jgi:F-type H+-transporting ATPase subunit c
MKKLVYTLSLLIASTAAFAEGAAGGSDWSDAKGKAVKACFYFIAVSLAAFGGTRSQSAAASVALEGIARNPAASDKLMVPMILALALMESLVIFTLITTFLV